MRRREFMALGSVLLRCMSLFMALFGHFMPAGYTDQSPSFTQLRRWPFPEAGL